MALQLTDRGRVQVIAGMQPLQTRTFCRCAGADAGAANEERPAHPLKQVAARRDRAATAQHKAAQLEKGSETKSMQLR